MIRAVTKRNNVQYFTIFTKVWFCFLLSAGTLLSNGILEAAENPSLPLILVAPFLGKPTDHSITVNIVAGEKPISAFITYVRVTNNGINGQRKSAELQIEPRTPAEITLTDLLPSTRYRYQLFVREKDDKEFNMIHEEDFQTQGIGKGAFSFAIFSDSHITPFNPERQAILSAVAISILSKRPDFALMLGDNIQTFTSHGGPMTEERFGPILYLQLRAGLDALPSAVPIFNVIGNWEGENGWHPETMRQWARNARKAFIPTPDPSTYREGGSEYGDYYGFTWGNALFLILNVTGYTPTDHTLQSSVGKPDDWTLGAKQKAWLHEQLKSSKERWKLLFIHHTVGGNAGDDINSRYGRGGGRAAETGEQAQIHRWMIDYHVQALFYGHDHVFTDIPVDGIHYICVGSAGAPWKFDSPITGYDTFWKPSGYTWVDVDNTHLRASFINPSASTNGEEEVMHVIDIPSGR